MELPLVTPQDGSRDNTTARWAHANKNTSPDAQAKLGSGDSLTLAPSRPYRDLSTSLAPETTKGRSLRWLWILLGVLVGLILIAYVGFSVFFMSHFTFNTTVNGVSVTFQSAESVNGYLASEIGDYALKLEARESQSATIAGSQIGLRYEGDGRIEDALKDQQPWAWPLAFFASAPTNIQHVSVEFDKEKLTTALQALPFMDETQMRPASDASLVFEGNAYVITPGDEGTTLNAEATTQAVSEAIYAGETTLSLEKAGVYLRPTIAADDPTLVANRDRFNQLVPFQIVYVLGDKREVLDGNTTINWVNEDGSMNPDAVRAWVADFAARYNTLEGTRTITNGFGEVKQVTGGTFGWLVDQESEYQAIMNAASQRISEERAPYWLNWGATFGENDWGSTYLEVDMSRQHMWYYVDGVVALETDVITGNPNTGYATPEGVWYIYSKSLNVVTRGDRLPDGSYEWEVPVTYWMPFTPSGCGFHDAYWQPSFGSDYYLYRGSHGCINMPSSLAEQLYSMVEPGTPVITHF